MSSWLTLTPTTLFLFLNLVIGTIAVTSRFTSANRNPQQQPLARAPSLLDRVKSIDFSLYKFPTQPEQQQQAQPQPHYFHQPTEEPPAYPVEPAPDQTPQLARAPSLLDRVKSINFSHYKFPNYPTHEPEPERYANPVESEQPGRLDRAPSLLERVRSIRLPSVYRSQEAETEVIGGNEEAETNTVHKPKRSKSETKKAKTKAKENMKKSASEKAIAVEKTADEETEMVERRRPQTARLERTVTVGDGDHAVDAKADDFINKFKRQLRLQRLDSLLRYKEMLQGK